MTHSVHTSTYELLPFEEYGNRIKSLSSSCDCINIFQVEVEDFDNEIFILSVDARDTYIEQLLPLLVQCEEWRDTEQYSFFASTLFPNITLTTLCGYHPTVGSTILGLSIVPLSSKGCSPKSMFLPSR